ncbi:hypothetical protein SKAU_G00300110 [Synaphobranchus kaupii]|uniref:Uncharacterized protein n=1 Tax=Synaphobranchus kaupii TaxID=118154 RepID=A0A9Q1EVJ7_SYNKA|nr:hypothetical protein SKAU_G00300110 [Synaphobranchus kaupii]
MDSQVRAGHLHCRNSVFPLHPSRSTADSSAGTANATVPPTLFSPHGGGKKRTGAAYRAVNVCKPDAHVRFVGLRKSRKGRDGRNLSSPVHRAQRLLSAFLTAAAGAAGCQCCKPHVSHRNTKHTPVICNLTPGGVKLVGVGAGRRILAVSQCKFSIGAMIDWRIYGLFSPRRKRQSLVLAQRVLEGVQPSRLL